MKYLSLLICIGGCFIVRNDVSVFGLLLVIEGYASFKRYFLDSLKEDRERYEK